MSSFQKVLMSADIFGSETSFFNFKGESKIKTIPGAIFSIGAIIVSLYFAVVTFCQMGESEEVEVKVFQVFDTQIMEKEYNLVEHGVDFTFGFNSRTEPFTLPPESLLTVEASLIKVDAYEIIENLPLDMGLCKDGNYDFERLNDPFAELYQANALCIKDKSKVNLSGMSDSPNS